MTSTVLPLEEYAVDPAGTKPIRDGAGQAQPAGPDGELSDWSRRTPIPRLDRGAEHDPAVNGRRWPRAAGRLPPSRWAARHYSLFDFRIDPEGRPWFLEAGLYCSFARQSVISTMAAAAGIAVGELLSIALDEALGAAHRPHPEKSLA